MIDPRELDLADHRQLVDDNELNADEASLKYLQELPLYRRGFLFLTDR